MKFIDEIYEYYKGRLLADDEDIEIIVGSILQELSREDMLLLLAELNINELYEITGTYMATNLRKKVVKDQSTNDIPDDKTNFYH